MIRRVDKEEAMEGRRMAAALLRSGEFRQIRGQYEDGNGGCCALGACKEALIRGGREFRDSHLVFTYVMTNMGLSSEQYNHIMAMNDWAFASLPAIADHIESLPEAT
jgi:hypothetical protein